MKAILALEDGSVFHGEGFGARGGPKALIAALKKVKNAGLH